MNLTPYLRSNQPHRLGLTVRQAHRKRHSQIPSAAKLTLATLRDAIGCGSSREVAP